MPPSSAPSSPTSMTKGDIHQLTKLMAENHQQTQKLMADNHQQTMEMFQKFNEQSQNTVKELFTLLAAKMTPQVPTQSSPGTGVDTPCSSKTAVKTAVSVPVVVSPPPKEVVDLTDNTVGEEKECPPPKPSAEGREKECSPVLRKPKIASVIKKVVKNDAKDKATIRDQSAKGDTKSRPIIRDHRRNLKKKSESDDSDVHKKQKLDRPYTARALAELTIPKVLVRTLGDDHQFQRNQFTQALIKLPVWFPMELSFTAYLVVRFLYVHEKARFHAKLHSDKGQNFQQYRKPFHYYGIKAAEIFDKYAQHQYVNQAFQQGGPQLKTIIPWFRQWPKQRMHQLTPHCQYFKQQKTVSLRTNVGFFERHLEKLGGEFPNCLILSAT